MPVDDEKVRAIQERRAAISPTPWTHDNDVVRNFDGGITADYSMVAFTDPEFKEADADAEFIANAPTDIDYLLSSLAGERERNSYLTLDHKRLADLLVKASDEVIKAVIRERERCAKIAEDDAVLCETSSTRYSAKGTAYRIAAAIRDDEELEDKNSG